MTFWNLQALPYFLFAFLLSSCSLSWWNNNFFTYTWALVLGSWGSYFPPVGAFPHSLLLVSQLQFILLAFFFIFDVGLP